MTTTTEATSPPQLEHKAATADLAAGATLAVQPEGVVTAIVSVTGVQDEVKDILLPGCYTETLTKRRPKVIRHHAWSEPVGRVLSLEEWLPGDARLPRETKTGAAWPSEAGALVAVMQYNMTTEPGRRAFADIAFYHESKEAEFSIGYQVPPGFAARRADGVRLVRKLDLFEISDVLFGAAPLSTSLSLKSAGVTAPPVDIAALHAGARDEIDWDEIAEADDDPWDKLLDPPQPEMKGYEQDDLLTIHDENGWMTEGLEFLAESKAAPAPKPKKKEEEESSSSGDFNSKHPRGKTGTPSGGKFVKKDSGSAGSDKPVKDSNKDGLPDDWLNQLMRVDPRYAATAAKKGAGKARAAKRAREAAARRAAAKAVAKAKALARAKVSAADKGSRAAEMERRDAVETGFENERDVEQERRATASDAIGKLDKTKRAAAEAAETAKRRQWDSSFRTRRAQERARRRTWESNLRKQKLARATAQTKDAAVDTGDGYDPTADHPYFPGADGLGCDVCDHLVDAELHDDASEVKAAFAWAEELAWLDPPIAPEEFEIKAGGADRNKGNAEQLRRWYLHEAPIAWGTPGDFMRCVAIAGEHMSPEHARGYCNLRHQEAVKAPPGKGHGEKKSVTWTTTEELLAAVFETKLTAWDPTAEVGDVASYLPAAQTKRGVGPELTGTLEEHRDRVRQAVTEALRGEQDKSGRWQWDSVTLLGTWPDRVVAQRENYNDGPERCETYGMTYTVDPESGSIRLSEPMPVELETVVVVPEFVTANMNGHGEELPPGVSADLDDASYALKSLRAAFMETKDVALSRINMAKLRSAVTGLLMVLEASGVVIDKPSKKQVKDETTDRGAEPVVTPDTTSDLAREEKSFISPEELAEGLALMSSTW